MQTHSLSERTHTAIDSRQQAPDPGTPYNTHHVGRAYDSTTNKNKIQPIHCLFAKWFLAMARAYDKYVCAVFGYGEVCINGVGDIYERHTYVDNFSAQKPMLL